MSIIVRWTLVLCTINWISRAALFLPAQLDPLISGNPCCRHLEPAALAGLGQAEISGAKFVHKFAEEQNAVAAAKVEFGAAGALREVV